MEKEQFINQFAEELLEGYGVYFIGAGVSVPSDLPSWSELIETFASNVGIKKLDGKNLPLIAQYIINEETGNRGPFLNAISRRLRKKYSPNRYHEWIAKTNLRTIWTTNYDNLIEAAFSNHIVDVKTNDDAISRDVPGAQVEIVKMHGCIFNSHRDEIVITESDYEDFFVNKPATAQRLKMELLQKSFLFLGYGLGDPNIKNIITETRRLARSSTRQHYLITKEGEDREFVLWSNNLKKYGIRVITIKNYDELDGILESLALKSRGKSVFITGSHQQKENSDARQLGEALAELPEVILIDGQSSGIMRTATSAFIEKAIEKNADINKRLKFFPNPYAANPEFSNKSTLLPMLKQWRLPIFKATQVVVAFEGRMGTQAEIEVALDLGCIVIPYFKQVDNKYLTKFLDNETLVGALDKYDSSYIRKARSNHLKIEDVISLIKKIFNIK